MAGCLLQESDDQMGMMFRDSTIICKLGQYDLRTSQLTGHLAKFGNMVGPWQVIGTPHLHGWANSSGLNSDDLVAGFGQWF
jgi:hypothetical protein